MATCLTMLVLTLLCPPLGMFGIIGLYFDQRHWKIYIICISLYIATVAYVYKPYNETDLIRYFTYIKNISEMAFQDAIATPLPRTSGLITFYGLSWFIGKIGDLNILPAMTVFCIYQISFYITWKIGRDTKINKKFIMLYTLFIIAGIPFYNVVNNIRQVFSFTVFAYALFRDCYLKKRNLITYLIYAFAYFFHTSVLILIIVRIFLPIIKKQIFISTLVTILAQVVVELLYPYFYMINSKNPILDMVKTFIVKGYSYFSDTDSSWGLIVSHSGSMMLTKYIYIAITVIVCVAYLHGNRLLYSGAREIRIPSKNEAGLSTYCTFGYIIGLMAIACTPMLTNSYWRFSATLIAIGGPIYLQYKSETTKQKLAYHLTDSIVLLSIFCMILWIRDMRYDNISEMLLNPWITSPFLVLLKVLFLY